MTKPTREFLKFFAPLALGIALIGTWFVHSRTQMRQEEIALRQSTVVAEAARFLSQDMSRHLADSRFLAGTVARAYGGGEHGLTTPELECLFMDFAASRPHYFQIRFLARDGHEVIRVDHYRDTPELVPGAALQDKSGRYYFQEAMKGGPDAVYISELDLNIEHGRIETPLRPTLRFATPVMGPDGARLGVTVLNFDASNLLGQVVHMTATPEGMPLFCNAAGHWFIAPTTEEAWGHLLERQDANMGTRFPEAWRAMHGKSRGRVRTKWGEFFFSTVDITPNATVPRGETGLDPGDRGWRIITLVTPADLVLPWRGLFALLTVLGLLVLGLGFWHFLNYRFRGFEAELRVRESEERLLAISQTSRNAIVMVDAEDRVTYWNPAAATLFGYGAEEVTGRELHAFLTPDTLAAMALGTAGGVPRVAEFEAPRKEGPPIPVELSTSRFRHHGSRYTVGFMRDITRRRQRETALRRSEETARALLNAPTESALLIDPAGTVLAINEVGTRRLCGQSEGVVGHSLFDFMEEDEAGRYRAAIDWVLHAGEPTEIESMTRNRRILTNAYPVLDEHQNVETVALFARDVTEQYQAEAALRHSEQRFRDISEAVGEFIWETDAADTFTFVTEDSALVLGYTPGELLGRPLDRLIPEAFQADFGIWRAQVMGGRQTFKNVEMQSQTRDGNLLWLRMSGVPYFEDEVFMGYRGAAMNITESKRQQEAIKASERKLRALAESAYDAILMTDDQCRISFWNPAAELLFGYREDEALGRDVHEIIAPPPGEGPGPTGLPPLSLAGAESASGEIREVEGTTRTGRRVPLELSVAGFRLNGRWFEVVTLRDITDRKATEAKLRELATTDALTGLNNRRRFMERAEVEFARSRRYDRSLSMCMMDIDHFKNVNDTHGHDVGDQVLSALAGIAVGALREADLLGRLGGEEFGVLLPETGREAALDAAERLRAAVERTAMRTSAGELRITVSIGVAVMNGEHDSVDALLKDADVALYAAKQGGRNRVATAETA